MYFLAPWAFAHHQRFADGFSFLSIKIFLHFVILVGNRDFATEYLRRHRQTPFVGHEVIRLFCFPRLMHANLSEARRRL